MLSNTAIVWFDLLIGVGLRFPTFYVFVVNCFRNFRILKGILSFVDLS